MQVKLGDLVLVENPFKIPGNYIVTHIGKDNLHFRGVLVVWKPKRISLLIRLHCFQMERMRS